MSCIVYMQLWPRTHLIIILFIQFIFINISRSLTYICVTLFILSSRFRSFLDVIKEYIPLRVYDPQERYLYGIALLKKEMALIFVYILFAFLYNCFGLVNNDYRMTSVKFRRWLIEALSVPVLLLGALFSHYIGCIDIFFDEYQSFYINAFMIKVPLFFLTR